MQLTAYRSFFRTNFKAAFKCLGKTLLIMNFTAFLLLIACLGASARGYTQKITLNVKNAALEEVFGEIRKQSGYSFVYTNDLPLKAKNVTVQVVEASVEETLKKCFANQPFTYKIINTVVIVNTRQEQDTSANAKILVQQYSIEVKGRVVNEKGEPVVATVLVKGTQNGTSTGTDGYFSLANVNENATLVISGISLEQNIEIKIKGKSDLGNIVIRTKVTEQDEVTINAGYYKTTDRTRTGNITKITAKDIEKQPVTSLLLALQGRVPGLDITPYNGVAGSAVKILIRGQNSVRFDGNYLLFIVDGIPFDSRPVQSVDGISITSQGFDPLSTIDPANIESIEVLKDADATAIYGSRGANGVVLITTKKSKKQEAGKVAFDATIYQGIGSMTRKLDLLNTQQYLKIRHEGFANDGLVPNEYAPDLTIWDTTRYTDWQKVLLGNTSNITDAQAGFSGGNATTSFRFAGDYHKETMIFPGDFNFQRYSATLNVNHQSTNQRFKSSLKINYGETGNNTFSDANLLNFALNMPPDAPPLYDANGAINWALRPNGSSTWYNPAALLLKTQRTKTNNLFSSLLLSYQLMRGLTLSLNAGYSFLIGKDFKKSPLASLDPNDVAAGYPAESVFGNNSRKTWNVEPQMNYLKHLGDHTLDIILGSSLQNSYSEYQAITGTGYTSDALLGSLQAAPTTIVNSDEDSRYKYRAVFGRIGYNFKEKYYLNFTGRRDGSSRFGPGNKFGNFGAIGAGWIFTREQWFHENGGFLSFGKIRLSYGTTGNDQIGDYKYYNTYQAAYARYGNLLTLLPSALFNPDYHWESTKKFEAAIDLSFFKDRFSLEISRYENRAGNQLVDFPLPATTGFGSVLSNFDAVVKNTGWEFVLSSRIIQTKTLQWNASFNLSLPHNVLFRYEGLENSVYYSTYKVGSSLSIQRVNTYLGIDPQTGLYTFLDRNNNGSILYDDEDKTFSRSLDKEYYGGLSNDLTYKSFQLSFLVQFSKQLIDRGDFSNHPGNLGNQLLEVLDYWQKPGDISKYQRLTSTYNSPAAIADILFASSDQRYVNGAFARLKTLSLIYTFPGKLLGKIKLEDAKLFIQGQNIFTITKYKGLDPETSNNVPPLRILTLGLQIKL